MKLRDLHTKALAQEVEPSPQPSPSPAPRQEAPSPLRELYREMASTPLFDTFPLVDLWLAERHPILWRKLRALDDELSSLERQGVPEETYRLKLEELLALCQQARGLRRKEGVKVWFQ